MNVSATEKTIAFVLEPQEAKDLLAGIEAGLSTKYMHGLQFSASVLLQLQNELTKFVGEEN